MTFPKGTAVLKATAQFSGQTVLFFQDPECTSRRAPPCTPSDGIGNANTAGVRVTPATTASWDIQDAAPQMTKMPVQVASSHHPASLSFINTPAQKA